MEKKSKHPAIENAEKMLEIAVKNANELRIAQQIIYLQDMKKKYAKKSS